jgi:NAD(P)-dependent dehydrogenase (short-subunit alcohol dehydrogenase family)
MLSAGFASLFESDGITVNACHPGDVRSKLSSDLGFGGHQSPDQGADTPVMLAINPRLDGVNGKYFEHQREKKCSFCADRAAVDKLMDICASY